MSKNVGKAIIGLACVGAAAGAVYAYLKNVKRNGESLDDDFDDFSDEFEAGERSYTTIPKDAAEELKNDAKQFASDVKDTAKDIAGELKEDAGKAAAAVKDKAESLAEEVKEKIDIVKEKLEEATDM